MKPADTANLIAGIALGGSALSAGAAYWSIRSSRKTAREQTILQAKLTAIEEERREEERERRQQEDEAGRRAQLDARVEPRDSNFPEAWELTVINDGPAPAQHVTFSLESIDGGDAPWIPPQAKLIAEGSLPVRSLPAGHERRYDITLKNYSGILVTVRWKDGTGPREQVFELQTRPLLPS
jgi:hypothetical protein